MSKAQILHPPKVVGEIAPSILSRLPLSKDGVYLPRNKRTFEVAKNVGSIIGLDIKPEDYVIHSFIVPPGESARAHSWHIDAPPAAIVANTLPTEFLVGEVPPLSRHSKDMVKTIFGMDSDRPGSFPSVVSHVLNSGLGDGLIDTTNLEVWKANPYELVLKSEACVHRSPINETDQPIRRDWVSIQAQGFVE